MQKEEIKQSWSASYIILTIVLSIITGIIGYFIKNIFDRPERRVLTVTETQTENLLNLDQKVHDEIITSYTLRNTPSETIKSYFRYSATIHNDGDVGVEKLKVFVQVNGSDVILVKSPSITTVPPDIHQGITLQQNKKVTEVSKDEWEVSLLNRHESITFTYIGYSTKEVNNASFKLVPRKKDWEVVREGTKTHSESNSFFRQNYHGNARARPLLSNYDIFLYPNGLTDLPSAMGATFPAEAGTTLFRDIRTTFLEVRRTFSTTTEWFNRFNITQRWLGVSFTMGEYLLAKLEL